MLISLKKISTYLSIIGFTAFLLPHPAFAADLSLSSNPVQQNVPIMITISGCPPNDVGKKAGFWWHQRGHSKILYGQTESTIQGDEVVFARISVAFTKLIDRKDTEMELHGQCPNDSADVVFFTVKPACDQINNFQYTKLPNTNDINVIGGINNCYGVQGSPDEASSLQLRLTSPAGAVSRFGITTSSGTGAFNVPGVPILTKGTWKVQLYYFGTPITKTANGAPNELNIQVAEDRKYACNDRIPDDRQICPDNCKPTQLDGIWYCGGTTRRPTPTPAAPTMILHPSPPCDNENFGINDGKSGQCSTFYTSIGPFQLDPSSFITSVFSLILGSSGGIALLIIISSGYRMVVSRGNPETIKNAREALVSGLAGLLFVIFSFVILDLIGITILQIPGLTR